jgi:hypothetical protein
VKLMMNMTEVSYDIDDEIVADWGRMLRSAWGRITWVMVCSWVMSMANGALGLAGVHGDDTPRTDSAI